MVMAGQRAAPAGSVLRRHTRSDSDQHTAAVQQQVVEGGRPPVPEHSISRVPHLTNTVVLISTQQDDIRAFGPDVERDVSGGALRGFCGTDDGGLWSSARAISIHGALSVCASIGAVFIDADVAGLPGCGGGDVFAISDDLLSIGPDWAGCCVTASLDRTRVEFSGADQIATCPRGRRNPALATQRSDTFTHV
jgi:hypothetical protein